jgi:hypothetical protein
MTKKYAITFQDGVVITEKSTNMIRAIELALYERRAEKKQAHPILKCEVVG